MSSIFVNASRWVMPLRALLWKFRSTSVSLIEDKDLMALLREIDRWDELLNERLRCSRCEKILTQENLAGFVVNGGDYAFLCDSKTCLNRTSKS